MQILQIFFIGCLGGAIFSFLHAPIPWTLGPLIATFIWKTYSGKQINWPDPIRNSGLIVLGYGMGSPFTVQIGHQIIDQLPGMLIATSATIFLSLYIGWMTSKRTGVSPTSAILGSMPGGLQQMALVSEEVPGADPSAVTLMQTTRLLTSVFFVPLVATYGLATTVDLAPIGSASFFPANVPYETLAYYILVSIVAAQVAKLLKMPTPYLLGPILGAVCAVLLGFDTPRLPRYILALGQVVVGIRMGATISADSLSNWKSIVGHTITGVLLVIATLTVVDFSLASYYNMSFLTAFISTAPGGVTEMGITAMSVHADIAIVLAYHLFRLFSIMLVGIPLTKWWLMRYHGAR